MNDALIIGDIPGALNLFNEIIHKGFEGHQFLIGLANHYRNLMVSISEQTVNLLEVSEKIREKYLLQVAKMNKRFLVSSIDILTQADFHYKSSQNKRLLVELSLMQIASLQTESEKKKSTSMG
jgi:DNA polymerase-3 subunit gamma/tau